jgi:hypothetical protein
MLSVLDAATVHSLEYFSMLRHCCSCARVTTSICLLAALHAHVPPALSASLSLCCISRSALAAVHSLPRFHQAQKLKAALHSLWHSLGRLLSKQEILLMICCLLTVYILVTTHRPNAQAGMSLRLRCTGCGTILQVHTLRSTRNSPPKKDFRVRFWWPPVVHVANKLILICCQLTTTLHAPSPSGKEEFEAALHGLWRSLLGPAYPERMPGCQPMAGQVVEPWQLWREVWAWGGPDVISRNKVRAYVCGSTELTSSCVSG